LNNSSTRTLSSNHNDTFGYGDTQVYRETHKQGHFYTHPATLVSDTVPNADYGQCGISQPLDHHPNELPMASRDIQLQDSTTAALLPQDVTFDHDNGNSSNAMYGHPINSQTSGSREANLIDPFSGFDIPFWFEQDQYWDIFQNLD
jgi:hypothetical protein